MFAAICVTALFRVSNELIAAEISKPSTRAVIVPMSAIPRSLSEKNFGLS